MPKKFKTIAFDIGGVLLSEAELGPKFDDRHMEIEVCPKMLEIIKFLAEDARYKIIIISKAFPKTSRKFREIIHRCGLDIMFDSVIFCEKIEEKAEIAKVMKVNVMIDDRQAVLDLFPEEIKTILFKQEEIGDLLAKISA
jgi:hypothetical protein